MDSSICCSSCAKHLPVKLFYKNGRTLRTCLDCREARSRLYKPTKSWRVNKQYPSDKGNQTPPVYISSMKNLRYDVHDDVDNPMSAAFHVFDNLTSKCESESSKRKAAAAAQWHQLDRSKAVKAKAEKQVEEQAEHFTERGEQYEETTPLPEPEDPDAQVHARTNQVAAMKGRKTAGTVEAKNPGNTRSRRQRLD